MPSPIVGPNVLSEVLEARIEHEAGLTQSKAGQYEDADQHYRDALIILDGYDTTVDVDVQSARVLRDTGFNLVRQAIATRSQETLSAGWSPLTRSVSLTGQILSESDWRPSPILAEIRSEHGATFSLLGRLATVEEVVFNDFVGDKFVSTHFDKAHNFLKQGSNGYYLVSNSLVAARYALVHNDRQRSDQWKKEAHDGFWWTLGHDAGTMGSVALTMINRRRDLCCQELAIASVQKRP